MATDWWKKHHPQLVTMGAYELAFIPMVTKGGDAEDERSQNQHLLISYIMNLSTNQFQELLELTVFLFFTCWLHSVKFYISGAVVLTSACIMFLTSRYFSDIIVCKISSSAAGRPFYDRVRLIRFCQKPALWSEHHIRNIVTYWETLGWVTSW